MLAYVFVLFAVAVRLLIPYMQAHPWHFTPVAACLLFFRRAWLSAAVLDSSRTAGYVRCRAQQVCLPLSVHP